MRRLLFLVLLCSCSPNSLQDFQEESKEICRTIIGELKRIESREDLLKTEHRLKNLFDQLVDVILSAQEYQNRHPEESLPLANPYNESLLTEMRRIYRMEGAREIFERAQRESLIRLSKLQDRDYPSS